MTFLRSKIALAVLGALLIGGAGGVLGALSAGQPHVTAGPVAANSFSNTSSAGSPTATPTHAAKPTRTDPPTTTIQPTATPTRVPPTPTPIPVAGQPLTVRGDVTSVSPSTNTFVVHVFNGGGTYTCKVTSSTQWSGAASSITTLQVGMRVDASGTYQGGGSISPTTSVDAQIDN